MSRFIKAEAYAIVPNRALKDKRLKMSTRFMWAYLCNLPNNWNYSALGLAAAIGCGEKSVRTALKELEGHGYLKRVQCREANKFAGYDYFLVENPEELPRSKSRTPITSSTTKSRLPKKADNKITNELNNELNKLTNQSSSSYQEDFKLNDEEEDGFIERAKREFNVTLTAEDVNRLSEVNADLNYWFNVLVEVIKTAKSNNTKIHDLIRYMISFKLPIEYNPVQIKQDLIQEQLKQVRSTYDLPAPNPESEFWKFKKTKS